MWAAALESSQTSEFLASLAWRVFAIANDTQTLAPDCRTVFLKTGAVDIRFTEAPDVLLKPDATVPYLKITGPVAIEVSTADAALYDAIQVRAPIFAV